MMSPKTEARISAPASITSTSSRPSDSKALFCRSGNSPAATRARKSSRVGMARSVTARPTKRLAGPTAATWRMWLLPSPDFAITALIVGTAQARSWRAISGVSVMAVSFWLSRG